MTRTRLIQWSGLAGVVSGVMLILLDLAFLISFGDQPERVAAITTTWLILLDFSIFATFLGLMALLGLYAGQVEEGGHFMLGAFLLASLGMVMNIGFLWGAASSSPP